MPIQGTTSASFVLGARVTPQSDTLILLPFEGTSGDTVVSDVALPRKSITFYGTAALDTNAKFGNTALSLSGGQDRVEILLTERTFTKFTLEAWVNFTNFTTYAPIISLGVDEDNVLEYATDGQRIRTRIIQNGIEVFNVITGVTAIQRNVWRHYVLVCDGTNMRFMIDGITYAYYDNVNFPFLVTKATIGNFLNGINNIGSISGFIDDVRISKAVKYADPYAVPILPLTVIDPSPFTIRNTSGNINAFSTTTIYINGANFSSDVTIVRFINNFTNQVLVTSSNVTFINSTQISATTDTSITSIPAGTYIDIQIESSLTQRQANFQNAFIVSNSPIWTTAAGNIGIFTNANRNFSVTVESTIPDFTPITYSIISGSLPANVTLNPTTGVISGLSDEAVGSTTYTFTIRAVANADLSRATDRTFNIVRTSFFPTWVTASGSLGSFLDQARAINIPISATVTNGGTFTYTIANGSLPTGLSLGLNTGIISGTANPVVLQTTSSFTVRATVNGDPIRSVTNSFTLTIGSPAIAWNTSAGSLTTAILNTGYSTTLSATASSGSITYSIITGSLPTGLSLNTVTGEISGTPSGAQQSYAITVRATTSSANVSVDQNFSITLSSLNMTASSAVTDPGTTVTMNISAAGFADNTILAYTITGVTSSDINNASLTGTAVVQSGAASIVIDTTDINPIGAQTKTATVTLDGRSVSSSFVIFKTVVTPTINSDNTVNLAWNYYTTSAGTPESFEVYIDGSLVASPLTAAATSVPISTGSNRTLLIRPIKSGLYTGANIVKTIRLFGNTAGQQLFTVPSLKKYAMVDVVGAQGGSSGGYGGRTRSVITTTPGETLYIYVGGQGGDGYRANCTSFPGVVSGGFNGGGAGGSVSDSYGCGVGASYALGPGGGGGSDIRQGGTALTNRIIIAGGGGGGAYPNQSCTSGGNVVGYGAGYNTSAQEGGVTGQTACGGGWPFGAQGRAANNSPGGPSGGAVATGAAGSLGQGGAGGIGGVYGDNPGYAGGGGGGYQGGGGAGANSNYGSGGSGGGGSGYLDSGLTTLYASYGTSNAGYNTGNGKILVIV